jgi:hypothetical protein
VHLAHHVAIGKHLLLLVVILDELCAEPKPRQRRPKIVGHRRYHTRTILLER